MFAKRFSAWFMIRNQNSQLTVGNVSMNARKSKKVTDLFPDKTSSFEFQKKEQLLIHIDLFDKINAIYTVASISETFIPLGKLKMKTQYETMVIDVFRINPLP